MTDYDLKKDTLTKLRKDLSDTPIVLGNTTISTLYRKYDTKQIDTNYCELFFRPIWFKEPNYHEVELIIDCYNRNEIMCDRVRTEIKKRVDSLILLQGIRVVNVAPNLEVTHLNTDRYVGRVTGMLYFHSSCN